MKIAVGIASLYRLLGEGNPLVGMALLDLRGKVYNKVHFEGVASL
jgi:hypothetical protein